MSFLKLQIALIPLIALHSAASEYQAAPLPSVPESKPGFDSVSPEASGVRFVNALSVERSLANQIYLNGSGVAAGDVNGDGKCDLYFCGLENDNALYINQGGWKFVDAAGESGVACSNLFSTGAALEDLDGDSDLDLLVNTILGGTLIFFNDGQGQFERDDENYPATRRTGSMSMALADADQDGDLDLYVANYRSSTFRDAPHTRFHVETIRGNQVITHVDGRSVREPDLLGRFSLRPSGGIEEHGELDAFYLNDGNGKFRPVSLINGAFRDDQGELIDPPYDWGLSVMFRDLNHDGLPDLYVCNDFASEDRVWLNQGGARFQAIPLSAIRKTSRFSMGLDVADFDRDGLDDLFVLDMLSRDSIRRVVQVNEMPGVEISTELYPERLQYPRNTAFRQRPDHTYAEIAQMLGVQASGWSWCAAFLDMDLDGYEDLLITNGHERDAQNIDVARRLDERIRREQLTREEILRDRLEFPRLNTPNVAYRNVAGMRFEPAEEEWGFDVSGVSHGMALADLDGDGDLDAAINNLNDTAVLLRNRASAPRISVELAGTAPNTQGVGSVIAVRGGPVLQTQQIVSGGKYLSDDQAIRIFAAGSTTNRIDVHVQWANGKESLLTSLAPNHRYRILEPSNAARSTGWSRDLSVAPGSRDKKVPQTAGRETGVMFREHAQFSHAHIENPFDDFSRQPSLTRKLSHGGPGISWHDWNGDGWVDLIVGGSRGGKPAVLLNSPEGLFSPLDRPPFHVVLSRDQTSLIGRRTSDGHSSLIAGLSNYEDGMNLGGVIQEFRGNRPRATDLVSALPQSVGPMAMADIDADGDLDLFVGGRCMPARYPEAVDSLIYENDGGAFQLDERNSEALKQAGLTSGAVFTDINRDGFPDLVLACEWGSVRLFVNQRGRLKEATSDYGLDAFTGWWNGVTAGDLNGDGLMDLVATNWGRNTSYEIYRFHSIRLYYADVDNNGALEFMESHYDQRRSEWLPHRGWDATRMAFPELAKYYSTNGEFAASNVDELMSRFQTPFSLLEANTLEAMVFMNHGERFQARPLPRLAQEAPAFGVCVADFNGDGREDIFLAQNFFPVAPDFSRQDAGRGLLLLGDGGGGFEALSGSESGIRLYGGQRAAATADFNRDGRLDLAVTQNAGETKLFENRSGDPGLTVHLNAGPDNAAGIGAVARLVSKDRMGPAREVRAGEGYGSQNDAALVFSLAEQPAEIEVSWPGGAKRRYPYDGNARELRLFHDGRVETMR